MLPDQLTEESIRAMCDARTYKRGLDYFNSAHVVDYTYNSSRDTLQAIVYGSYGNSYEQEIFLVRRSFLRGICTCPVGINCKHVVAALLDYLDDLECDRTDSEPALFNPGKGTALNSWKADVLSFREKTGRKAVSRSSSQNNQLLYVLEKEEGICTCRLIKSRWLKRGEWGRSTPVMANQVLQWYSRPEWVTPEDVEIVTLMDNRLSPLNLTLEIRGDLGFFALRKMLDSGRCFWARPSISPLCLGQACTLKAEWEETSSAARKLNWKVEDHDGERCVVVIPSEPPCYVDVETCRCGELKTHLSVQDLGLLTQLPEVGAEDAHELGMFLLNNFHPEHVPLPVEVKVRDADDNCVPCLQFLSRALENNQRVHVARLTFEYAPLSIPAADVDNSTSVDVVEHKGEYWKLKRDAEYEDGALTRIYDMGFEPCETVGLPPSENMDLVLPADTIPESVAAWKSVLNRVPAFEAEGWKVEIDPSFQLQFVEPEELTLDVNESSVGWFDVGLEIGFEGRKIALLPLVIQYLEQGENTAPLLIELEDGRWLECPRSVVRPVVETLLELHDAPALDASGALSLPTARVHALSSMEERIAQDGSPALWRGGEELKALAERLRHFEGIENVPAPAGLSATLRDYQLKGLSWLQFLRDYAFGGILADDMGLGKTVQTLAHIMVEKEAGRLENPVLVVAPTSVLSTWRTEAQRFAPDLQVLVWHGAQRNKQQEKLPQQDLIITSYALLQRDAKLFQEFEFQLLILDEAQAIKNPATKVARAACAQPARYRLCLTGTPVENHLGELWSLFNFLMPGYMGNKDSFRRLFRNPIEKQSNIQRRYELERRIHPFVLRRDKQEVATELPPKTTIVSTIEFESSQARLYESVRSAMSEKVAQLLQQKGLKKSRIEILDALLKLRQVCCDPRLVKLDSARKVKHSAKLERLLQMLETLLNEGRKILVFSQFVSMLSLIEDELKKRSVTYTKLTGRTRKRDEAIQHFQSGDASVFLISLKAGGVGLNLTAADTVIHYDPWWNPAVENQATDRAYRIGQDKPVFVYKLVAQNTIEEKILELQEKKSHLADVVSAQGEGEEEAEVFNGEQLLELLEH